ncbi:MAG: YggS family pyridoxal phosphate-dependent enzyme [Betaproteobacteria bacterium]|nr:YggS family pyridoxal phosphate-dependent enzyme [Betaproteobacteria bacterium]
MNTILQEKLLSVRQRIARQCAASGRDPGSVQLLAVSKTFPLTAILEAHQAGQTQFGENYIQEGVDKILACRARPDCHGIEWHCIGPIQSNKTRLVATHFDWVHSVDRLKIAQRLSEQRPQDMPPLNICIQVNIDGGANKAGVAPADALDLARQVAALPRVQLRGLMTIPEPAPDYATALATHQAAKALWDRMRDAGIAMDTLSLGMSADLEAAIAAGSTMVRVGSAVFGAR